MKKFITANILTIVTIIILSLTTVGYALYGETVQLNGKVTIAKPGILEITNAQILTNESSNLASYTAPTYEGTNINFSITGSSKTFTATYLIEITNNSYYDYTFLDFAFNPSIAGTTNTAKMSTTITNYETGAAFGAGDGFAKGSVTKLKVKFEIETEEANTTVNMNGNTATSENNTGTMAASISPTEGNLQGDNNIACFTLSVVNSYSYTRTFNLTSSNENIKLVDNTGVDLSNLTINANATNDYEICTMIREGSIFLTDSTHTSVVLSSNGISNITVDTLTLAVDIDINATDKDIPQVGGVTLAISESNPTIGEATLTWNRIDSGGSSIVNYHIILYNETTGQTNTYSTGNDITSYTFTNLSEGTYYAKVYGEDEAGNIGSSYCDSATTENGYCSRSASVALKWVYSVTYDLSRLASDGASTATLNSTYEATLSVSTSTSGYSLPSSITVTMGGTELTSGTDYTYNTSSGKIVINKVTGDITIEASATWYCLIEGTKVRLADGTYKNIEEIKYDDLLAVYNHEDGGITYEYPIWIEKATKVNYYQLTSFSDGTTLKTFGSHGVFSLDQLKYVSVTDIKVGDKIAKIASDGSIIPIIVTNIEIINEETSYYNVSSTRFHNIIAEDLLTTDGSIISSNVFSFDENIKWTSERDNYLATNDLFNYETFKYIFPQFNFPEHIFRGYRMEEMKYLYNQGLLDIEMYFNNLKNLESNPIQDVEGNNLWMITTSDDVVINKSDFLVKQGSYYTLPTPLNNKEFTGWYNTADGKIYQPGDKIRVVYGMHFIAQ